MQLIQHGLFWGIQLKLNGLILIVEYDHLAYIGLFSVVLYRAALSRICAAVGPRAQTFSLPMLASLLSCDVSDIVALCTACGMQPGGDTVALSRSKCTDLQMNQVACISFDCYN